MFDFQSLVRGPPAMHYVHLQLHPDRYIQLPSWSCNAELINDEIRRHISELTARGPDTANVGFRRYEYVLTVEHLSPECIDTAAPASINGSHDPQLRRAQPHGSRDLLSGSGFTVRPHPATGGPQRRWLVLPTAGFTASNILIGWAMVTRSTHTGIR